jgi:hypothetical protein
MKLYTTLDVIHFTFPFLLCALHVQQLRQLLFGHLLLLLFTLQEIHTNKLRNLSFLSFAVILSNKYSFTSLTSSRIRLFSLYLL